MLELVLAVPFGVEGKVAGKATKGGWSFTCVFWLGDKSLSSLLTLHTLFSIYILHFNKMIFFENKANTKGM